MPEINKIDQKKLQIWLPFLLSLMVVIGMLVGFKMSGTNFGSLVKKLDNGAYTTGRVEEIIRYIESKYVDEINSEELIEEALISVLNKLDPHSLYLTPEMVKRTNEEMEGSFNGLGIESMMIEDTLNVYHVLEGSPADVGGLKMGDKIIQIGDSVVANRELSFEQIRPLFRSEDETLVTLQVLALGNDKVEEKTVEIGPVAMHSAEIGYMLDDKTGYILIKRFGSNTYKEFMLVLEDMVEKQNLENLIIDVRQNPGGYLPQATDILSQLFPQKGHILVYTEGKNERLTEYKSTGKSFFPINQIAVLVDGGSASGSEILAGAIQDWDRGVIVGRRTFGKGLVQEQYNLKNGAALRLTIARYFTPSGRLIQKPYENLDNYGMEQIDRFDSGELTYADKMIINDSTEYYTLKDRRIVYGGGGIIPDIFVPLSPAILDTGYRSIIQFMREFVFLRFRDLDFESIEIPSEEMDYGAQDLLVDLKDFVINRDSSIQVDLFSTWEKEIVNELNAAIANQLFGETEMIKVSNKMDTDIEAALKAFKDN